MLLMGAPTWRLAFSVFYLPGILGVIAHVLGNKGPLVPS